MFLLQVTGNICQIFNKFVSDGKATIRFKQPEEDICINKVGAFLFLDSISE